MKNLAIKLYSLVSYNFWKHPSVSYWNDLALQIPDSLIYLWKTEPQLILSCVGWRPAVQGAKWKGRSNQCFVCCFCLLCVAHGFCFVFFIFWFPSALNQEGKSFLNLISQLRTVLVFWLSIELCGKITPVHVCVYTQSVRAQRWKSPLMCTAYKAIINLNMLFYLQKKFSCVALLCRTVTWSSTGCLTASAKSAMTVVRNSPPSVGGTTVDFVGRSSVVDAAIKKSLGNSWATQVARIYSLRSRTFSVCSAVCTIAFQILTSPR